MHLTLMVSHVVVIVHKHAISVPKSPAVRTVDDSVFNDAFVLISGFCFSSAPLRNTNMAIIWICMASVTGLVTFLAVVICRKRQEEYFELSAFFSLLYSVTYVKDINTFCHRLLTLTSSKPVWLSFFICFSDSMSWIVELYWNEGNDS